MRNLVHLVVLCALAFGGASAAFVPASGASLTGGDQQPGEVQEPGLVWHVKAPTGPGGDKLQAPVKARLSFDTLPALGGEATLRLEATALVDAPQAAVSFDLTGGFALVSGSPSWSGSLKAGELQIFTLQVRAVQAGEWPLHAEVNLSYDSATLGRTAYLYVTLSDSGPAAIHLEPAGAPVEAVIPVTRLDETDPALSGMPSVSEPSQPTPNAPAGTINVSGTWRYRNLSNGVNDIYKARVEIWDSCYFGLCDARLATAYTDGFGHFSVTGIPNTGDEWGTRDIYVKVFAADDHSAHVSHNDGSIYVAQSAVTNDVQDGDFYAGTNIAESNESHGNAFFIFGKLVSAWSYLNYIAGWDNNYNLEVNWQNDSGDGTYYNLNHIHMLAGDGYDPDVFLHAYGHFVMSKIYTSYPQTPSCSENSWGAHTSTGCAWVEGWANFLQAAIQNDAVYQDSDDQNISINIEAPNPWADHDSDAGAVTAALWDIYDSGAESWDSLSNSFNGSGDNSGNGIWDTVFSYDPNSVSDFWYDWCSNGSGAYPQVWSILYHAAINYDFSAPAAPSFASSSASPSIWTNDPTVDISWNAASDGCGSGVAGYSYAWDTTTNTTPNSTVDTTSLSATTPPGAGYPWYFHLRACDNAGNCSPAAHLGPFMFDTTQPSLPYNLASSDHTAGAWSNDNTVTATWSPATDMESGVAGYSTEWTQSADTLPDTAMENNLNGAASPALADGAGWFLHIRTRDYAGNWTGSAIHFGPFNIDTAAPTSSVTAADPAACGMAFHLSWQGSDPGGSGVAGYTVQFRLGTSGEWTDWLAGTTQASAIFGLGDPLALAPEATVYFRVRAADAAGNLEAYPGGDGDLSATANPVCNVYMPLTVK